jgi:hypothetical protein
MLDVTDPAIGAFSSGPEDSLRIIVSPVRIVLSVAQDGEDVHDG